MTQNVEKLPGNAEKTKPSLACKHSMLYHVLVEKQPKLLIFIIRTVTPCSTKLANERVRGRSFWVFIKVLQYKEVWRYKTRVRWGWVRYGRARCLWVRSARVRCGWVWCGRVRWGWVKCGRGGARLRVFCTLRTSVGFSYQQHLTPSCLFVCLFFLIYFGNAFMQQQS